MMKLPRLFRLLEPKKRIEPNNSQIDITLKFANFILYNVFRSSNPCLLRSLMLFRRLRMMGLEIKIAFGVKDDIKGLKGHAWLVLNESHFMEQNDPSLEYRTVYVYP